MCMYVFYFSVLVCSMCLNVCLYTICLWYPWKPEEGSRSPGTAVTGDCELPAVWVFEMEPGFSGWAGSACNY